MDLQAGDLLDKLHSAYGNICFSGYLEWVSIWKWMYMNFYQVYVMLGMKETLKLCLFEYVSE